MNFQFSHQKFINALLPSAKRKNKMLAWLEALVSPLITLYADFLEFQERLKKEANYNSQVGVLEWLLNERFDTTSRRIRILDAKSFATPIRAYLRSEARPRLAAYLRSEGEAKMQVGQRIEYSTDDFIVQIPSDLNNAQIPITRLVNKYKMGGKHFSIIIS